MGFKQELQTQRENTEKCLSILTDCQTRDQIIEGLSEISRILKQSNDPLAEAVEKASIGCIELSDEYILRLKDDFIRQCKRFLSATDDVIKRL